MAVEPWQSEDVKWRSVRGDGVISGPYSRSGDYVIYWPFPLRHETRYRLQFQGGSMDRPLGLFDDLKAAKRAAETHASGSPKSGDRRRRKSRASRRRRSRAQ